MILLCFVVEYFIEKAKKGDDIYMRPIAAIKAMEEAVGRATEMGKPVLYVPVFQVLIKLIQSLD